MQQNARWFKGPSGEAFRFQCGPRGIHIPSLAAEVQLKDRPLKVNGVVVDYDERGYISLEDAAAFIGELGLSEDSPIPVSGQPAGTHEGGAPAGGDASDAIGWVKAWIGQVMAWIGAKWKSLYLVVLVLASIAGLVVAEKTRTGAMHIAETSMWSGLGVWSVMSAIKDAWDLRVPYVLLLFVPYLATWLVSKLVKACTEDAEAVGVFVTVALVLLTVIVAWLLYHFISKSSLKQVSIQHGPCHCAHLATS